MCAAFSSWPWLGCFWQENAGFKFPKCHTHCIITRSEEKAPLYFNCLSWPQCLCLAIGIQSPNECIWHNCFNNIQTCFCCLHWSSALNQPTWETQSWFYLWVCVKDKNNYLSFPCRLIQGTVFLPSLYLGLFDLSALTGASWSFPYLHSDCVKVHSS